MVLRQAGPRSSGGARAAAAALVLLLLPCYLLGLEHVPFHPDEASWIHMSREFLDVFVARRPGELAAAQDPTDRELRLLNAPLAKYLIGAGLWLAGFPERELCGHWDWSQSFAVNRQRGELPGPALLVASRRPAALLAALSAAVLLLTATRLRGLPVGVASGLLLGLSPLVLLHGRRAMAEGPMLFFSLLAFDACLRTAGAARVPAWRIALLGVWLGLAVLAKQTALPLLGVAGLGLAARREERPLVRIGQLTLLAAATLATFVSLSPVLWQAPLATAREMLGERVAMTRFQVRLNAALAPQKLLETPGARIVAALEQVLVAEPEPADLPLYRDELAASEAAYLETPASGLPRGLALGSALGLLALLGSAASLRRIWRDRLGAASRGEQLLGLWTLMSLGMVLLLIPFAWQRYYLGLVAPVSIYVALGLQALGGRSGRGPGRQRRARGWAAS